MTSTAWECGASQAFCKRTLPVSLTLDTIHTARKISQSIQTGWRCRNLVRGGAHSIEFEALCRSSVSQVANSQEPDYDVYVNEPQPLSQGEHKHIISVFVADESGIINRVAGVFARRGANIDSLAVGLNLDKALFTIVVTGTERTVANLVKQLAKLVKVRYVEDITNEDRVERELVLIKVSAPPGLQRTEALQLLDIFRARCIDISEQSLTVCVSGDAGKTHALQQVLSKFGIIEIARTGKISLKRGTRLLEMGGWGDGQSHKQNMHNEIVHNSSGPSTLQTGADVYAIDSEAKGVWEVENVLNAAYDSSTSEFEPHTLSIEVHDVPGVLNQVSGVFARRGYNIQSLAVGPCERYGLSRIITVVPGNREGTSKIQQQLYKLVHVRKVSDLSAVPFASRELMLVKVGCSSSQRGELTDLVSIFHGNICDVSLETVTLEVQGTEGKMQAIQTLLAPYGILEVARTGRVALSRESGLDTKYLGKFRGSR